MNNVLICEKSKRRYNAARKEIAEDIERTAKDLIAEKAVMDEEKQLEALKKKNYKKMFAEHVK